MTTDKDFKRVVRARMQKTGESYTTARAAVSRKSPPDARVASARGARSTTAPAATDGVPPRSTARAERGAPARRTAPADYARVAGMSDDALAARTGCTWEKWVWTLDKAKANTWSHTEIARYVRETYKIPGWWAQTVTVGYERIHGLREKGQRREGPQAGRYEASKSRTYPVSVDTLYAAMHDARRRARWMGATGVTVRTATANRSIRLRWNDGTPVQFWFTAKGTSKASVSVQHEGFSTREAADAAKVAWGERLDALGSLIADSSR